MAKHVLAASNAFRTSHIELYDFALPAAAGMWNLRWQVRGYVDAKPSATATELSNRFVFGSGLSYRNLRAPFVDREWEEQQDQFARFLLTNLVSLYEGYVAEIENSFAVPGTAKRLQFPSEGVGGQTKPGIAEALSTLTMSRSSTMERNFQTPAATHPRYKRAHLDELLIMYRYFKEVRNAFAHKNGVIEDYMSAISTAAKSLPDAIFPAALPSRLPALVPGARTSLSWRDVQSFSEILLQVVSTIDAELSGTTHAEEQLIEDWEKLVATRRLIKSPTGALRRQRWIANHVVALGYPRPADPESLDSFLTQAGLLR